MKKIIVCIIAVLVAAGSVFAAKSVQGTNTQEISVNDEELETEVKLDIPEQLDTVQIEVEEKIESKEQVTEAELSIEVERPDKDTLQTEIDKNTEEEQDISGNMADELQAKEEAAAVAEAEARAFAKTQVKAEEEAALIESQAQMQITSQTENVVTEVSRTYIEDCGSDSGYWEITYSDGHVEYIDD